MAPTSPVHFQHDLPLGPLRVGSHSVFRRFTPNWFESSKKPFSHQDGHDVKNYRQQERIFALFHSIEPRRAEMSVRVHRCGTRRAVCWHKSSSPLFKCLSVFCPPPPLCSPGFSSSLTWWQTCSLPDGHAHRRMRAHSQWSTGAYQLSRGSAFTCSSLLSPFRFFWQLFHCTGLNWIWTLFKLALYTKVPKSLWREFDRLGWQPMTGALVM